MMTWRDDPQADLRRAIYVLLIVTSVGAMTGRIFTVTADHGRNPFLSANDRSRWCTIRALVDHGTYVIDDVIYNPRTESFDHPYWNTIDKVRHKGTDGREHFYSSKPTLLPTLLAIEYWLIKNLTGATLAENPFYVGRAVLIFSNVLPLVAYFVLLAKLVERYGKTDWGRIFVMACATWGTFLTTFAVTLNNHLPAAISVLFTIYATLPIWYDGERRYVVVAIAGLFSAFTAACELPALSFFVLVAAVVAYKCPKRFLIAFVPAAAVVLVALFLTNYLAHDSWRPPYAHRKDGRRLATIPVDSGVSLANAGPIDDALRVGLNQSLSNESIEISSHAVLHKSPNESIQSSDTEVLQRWVLWDPDGHDRLVLLLGWRVLYVHAWDNWYEYDDTYWRAGVKSGVDRGERSRVVYAFQILFGHHGILSLTPIWLFGLAGLVMLLVGPEQATGILRQLFTRVDGWLDSTGLRKLGGERQYGWRTFGVMVLMLSLVCLLFYIARPLKDRNYGGRTCGFRWMFWFAPMWLLCMLPAADAIATRRRWRIAAYCLLAISVTSACYASLNPWVDPWMYRYLEYLGYFRPPR